MNTAENINIPLELNVKFMAIFVSLFESEIVFTFFDLFRRTKINDEIL